MSTVYSLSDVASHTNESSAWLIIDGGVYDVTSFLSSHPGGKKILLNSAGKDASAQFKSFHKPSVLEQYKKLKIGTIAGSSPSPSPSSSALVPSKPSSSSPSSSALPIFGEQIPYGDPSWYQGWHSPFFIASHHSLRAAVRAFVDKEVAPFVHEWDEKKQLPKEIFRKLYEAGILPGTVGAPWPERFAGSNIAGGVAVKDFDYFHELIIIDELCRPGSGGFIWGASAGLTIGLPPVLHYALPALKEKVCGPCLRGEKFICLAITEPAAGSDVANITTTAKKSPCGKYYIVNGEKKWITNGIFADFFTVAVRTGGKGMGGISLLLIERSEGVTTRSMNCQGVWSSGTTYVTFEDVKVPVENLIGVENNGFKYIMTNFNHERMWVSAQALRFARVCLEESFKYATKRKTFGKLLIEHPVIRLKLSHMARQVEATQSMIEQIVYQMNKMPKAEAEKRLGGPMALLKAQCSIVMEYCAREASQIFGGLSYSRGGQGEKIERLYREVRAYAIPAGSEEIMLDLSVRQALKNSTHNVPAKL